MLVQVNVTGEPQKGGCPPEETAALVDACLAQGCRVEGLMTVPALAGDPRPAFARLRQMTDLSGGFWACLMLGMRAATYEMAITCGEGATMVRVGGVTWGPRSKRRPARR